MTVSSTRLPTFSLILPALLMLILGCEEGSEPEIVDPDPDPNEALLASLVVVEQSVIGQLDNTRNRLNGAASQLSPYEPTDYETGQVLQSLVEYSDNKVWMAVTLGESGQVDRVYPTEMNGLLGQDWSNRHEIATPLAETGLATGAVHTYDGNHTLFYTRSIGGSTPSTVEGVLAAGLLVDPIIELAVGAFPDSIDYRYMMLQDDGIVLWDEDDGYFGEQITDESVFSAEQVAIAAQILSDPEGEGYSSFNASGGPGGEGMVRVAWRVIPLYGSRHWIAVLTEPMPEGEE